MARERVTGSASPEALAAAPERVLTIGTGHFLRAFAVWMAHEMNRRGLFHGRVVLSPATPESQTVRTIHDQQGVYTVLRRGYADGEWRETTDIVTAVSRAISPFADWPAFLELAARPALRFVVSNTTEAGIAYEPAPWPGWRSPRLFPARAAGLLHHRFVTLGGRPETGLVFLPCELIERNGERLRELVLRHAEEWRLGGEFRAWVERSCRFLDTLVDRIVPGFPAGEAESLFARMGYEDPLLTACEEYHSWVIAADEQVAAEWPLSEAGLNVIWAGDVERYRRRKVRILNGTHTMLTPVALLAGRHTVRESVEDPLLAAYLRRGLYDEILPSLDLPAEEKVHFAGEVLERFRNPSIEHRLVSIALNGVSKWRVRVWPSVRACVEAGAGFPTALVFSLAALLVLYRRPEAYGVHDTPEALAALREAWSGYEGSPDRIAWCRAVLSRQDLWGEDLSGTPGLAGRIAEDVQAIQREGMDAVLRRWGP